MCFFLNFLQQIDQAACAGARTDRIFDNIMEPVARSRQGWKVILKGQREIATTSQKTIGFSMIELILERFHLRSR